MNIETLNSLPEYESNNFNKNLIKNEENYFESRDKLITDCKIKKFAVIFKPYSNKNSVKFKYNNGKIIYLDKDKLIKKLENLIVIKNLLGLKLY